MARYRDPRAPAGRVVFGGVEFVDGVTADIDAGEGALELFESAGIVEVPAETRAPTKADLQAEAAELGLDTGGTKAEIQARIDEHQAAETDLTEE